MKGFVPTPDALVDRMVDKLFAQGPPTSASKLLDPGCGPGAFIKGVLRWCDRHDCVPPSMTGIELDPKRAATARREFSHCPGVQIVEADFLQQSMGQYDYVIGNPPYVSIGRLSEEEKARYRKTYKSARGRFDLYLLFFEQALRLLRPNGRLVFITPEKFAYVGTAEPLRRVLGSLWVQELDQTDEATFGGLVTYPMITTVTKAAGPNETRVFLRDGATRTATLPPDGSSWLPVLNGHTMRESDLTLADVCTRISCGVATGADSVFVMKNEDVPAELSRFAYPTIAGRQISEHAHISTHSMLVPYASDGRLLEERRLGPLGDFLRLPPHRQQLMERTCVQRKPWYSFHETPPLSEMLTPKILCKDIAAKPFFVVDTEGRIVPRHSVYYIIPQDPSRLGELATYLNSQRAREWLTANSHRAANGFYRLQSTTLKRLPVPARLAASTQTRLPVVA